MLEKSRKLLAFRKRIIKLLTEQFGYVYEDKRKEWEDKTPRRMYGPHIEGHWLVSLMERINTGEAYYRAEVAAVLMEGLARKQANGDSTRTHDEAVLLFFDLLFGGWEKCLTPDSLGYDEELGGEKQYITVNYVDWLHPRNNQFCVSEGWRGCCNNGVAWDLIISVNRIPLVAVMMAPTTPGHRPCQEAYDMMFEQLMPDLRFDTSCMLCIISDGHTTLVGSPDDPPEWFLPWDVPQEVAREAEAKGGSESATPFYALLQPEVLLRYLYGYVRPVGEDEDMVRYCAHSHQFYAVDAALHHLLQGEGQGYAVLPESDEQLRSYPFLNNYDTTRQLMVDNMQMGLYGEVDPARRSDAKVSFKTLPEMSLAPDGVCVYRPQNQLVSPLASTNV